MGVTKQGVCSCGYVTESFSSGPGYDGSYWMSHGWKEEEPAICLNCMTFAVRDRLRESYNLTCPSCQHRFKKTLRFARMEDEPCIRFAECPKCSFPMTVESAFKAHSVCGRCRRKLAFYYDAKELWDGERSTLFSWDRGLDERTQVLCPQCGKKTMRFVTVLCWD